jgi:hypothetical protein
MDKAAFSPGHPLVRFGINHDHKWALCNISSSRLAISAYRRALGLIGNRLSDPGIDAQPLPQFVSSPECPLPWLFELTRVGELIAMSAQKITGREHRQPKWISPNPI